MTTFKHYKGDYYKLICIANHTETGEKLVVYKNEKDECFARPYEMFYQTIQLNGVEVPRFAEVKENRNDY